MRATLHLATLKSDGYVSIRAISEELDISFHFLTKIFQKLTQAGILASFRGPNGGVALARPATRITLLDIVIAIDGPELFTECVLGLPGCGDAEPCPLHPHWATERQHLRTMLEETNLKDMAERIGRESYRLKFVPPLE